MAANGFLWSDRCTTQSTANASAVSSIGSRPSKANMIDIDPAMAVAVQQRKVRTELAAQRAAAKARAIDKASAV